MVERLHAVEVALLDGVVDQGRLVGVEDEVTYTVGRDHHLHGRHAAFAVGHGKQALRDDGLQRAGQHDAHLLLLVQREEVDDAVDGLGGVDGVECAQDEVARLSCRERGAHRLRVAHLADEDHVGVLTQHVLQGRHVGVGVQAYLALVDHRLVVAVQDLDGVLDGDDVTAQVMVDVVDHRGQGRRLATARGPSHQDHAARRH